MNGMNTTEFGILNHITTPAELRTLSYEALTKLCAELRAFIWNSVAQTGGHLASNLGVVELAVALEREFDSFHDRIIYDVGHQSYVHKILTGRREAFPTLRQYGGLSGFMKPEESSADPCITGHASSSVSVALGMARARTLRNQKYHVVAVIGDGAMTGGIAYEALNDAGTSGEPLLVVLNDNNMSIARNVGGLSRHLSRLRLNPRYWRAKSHVKQHLTRMPGGSGMIGLISRWKTRIKRMLLPSTLFEQMGFLYLGPVDGHDIKSVCELLDMAKKMKKPVLLHVMTKKGRGYRPSEQYPEQFHGVSPFNARTGQIDTAKSPDFSACFGEELCTLATSDSRLCAITAAMPSGTGLDGFATKFPSRFFDVGIAEEHAVALAAGMAAQGLIPVVAIYSTFLQRAYDQLIHDVAIGQPLHLLLCVDRAGIVGADGATHNGVFDVGFLRQIPGFKLYTPATFDELRVMLRHAIYHEPGAVAIRYPRGGTAQFELSKNRCGRYKGSQRESPNQSQEENPNPNLSQSQSKNQLEAVATESLLCVREGGDALLATYGVLIDEALKAADLLSAQGIEAAVYKWNELTAPLDSAFVQQVAHCHAAAVIEDVVQAGGMGEATATALALQGLQQPNLFLLNTGNRFLPHGSIGELRHACGIDAQGIVATLSAAFPDSSR